MCIYQSEQTKKKKKESRECEKWQMTEGNKKGKCKEKTRRRMNN